MSDLMKMTNEEVVTMTSLEVVDLINKFREEEQEFVVYKEHKTFMRDIRNEIEKLGKAGIEVQYNFVPYSYIAENGKTNPCYKMNKAGIMQMLNKESALVRYKTQKYIESLENRLNENKPTCIEDVLITSLQEMKMLKQQLNQINNNALRANKLAIEAQEEVKSIKEVVSLDTVNWRSETQTLIAKIARNQGGFEHINLLKSESYELLNKRFGVKLDTRLTNKRRRMAEEGVTKSKRDKLNYLDVISEDKKLIEGYVAIVKDMAIKYGISNKVN